MPTYEYRCKDCGHTFDAYQSFSDAALTECPECHGALKKVFGNVGIAFKGSGFYKNDSRGGKTAKSGNGDTSKSSSGSSNGSSPSGSDSSSGSDAKASESKTSDSKASGSSTSGGSDSSGGNKKPAASTSSGT